jgi:hypothetical protein
MGRRLSATLFAFAFVSSMLSFGKFAVAGVSWCEEDPVFMVNGAVLDVTTAIPASYVSTLKGPMTFEVLVPSNATAAVISLPSTIPATAKISRSLPATGLLSLGVPVVVKVTVPATASFDTKTQVTGTYLWLSSTEWGKSNVTTKVSYTLIGL